ncbi:hypothetical protein LUZ60_002004 [Juncus effusus]|nr:hypothetical protein LUZ60_002004 [Juncus effusus]
MGTGVEGGTKGKRCYIELRGEKVCFSKRRNSLFKKALELTELCGAHIKIITFSPAGKPFSFIHSSDSSNVGCDVSHPNRPPDQDRKLSELDSSIKVAKIKTALVKASLGGADVASLERDELEAAVMKRQRLIADLALRCDELSIMPHQLIPVYKNGYRFRLEMDMKVFIGVLRKLSYFL